MLLPCATPNLNHSLVSQKYISKVGSCMFRSLAGIRSRKLKDVLICFMTSTLPHAPAAWKELVRLIESGCKPRTMEESRRTNACSHYAHLAQVFIQEFSVIKLDFTALTSIRFINLKASSQSSLCPQAVTEAFRLMVLGWNRANHKNCNNAKAVTHFLHFAQALIVTLRPTIS